MFFGSLHKGHPKNAIFIMQERTHNDHHKFFDFQIKGIVEIAFWFLGIFGVYIESGIAQIIWWPPNVF
jgi:hypothetical protein